MFRDFTKYEVYDDGRVWSYKRNKFLKPKSNGKGYQQVCLTDNDGNAKWYYLHRVVYESVSGAPIPRGYEVNHIDERKDNNMRSNLELVTHKENINFGSRNARVSKAISKALSKQVGAFKNDELVMTFPSTREAGRQGFHQGSVAACCRGESKTHKGFQWKYI